MPSGGLSGNKKQGRKPVRQDILVEGGGLLTTAQGPNPGWCLILCGLPSKDGEYSIVLMIENTDSDSQLRVMLSAPHHPPPNNFILFIS